MIKPFLTLLIFIGLGLNACKPLQNTVLPAERITVGSGPEDMVPDSVDGRVRLLISCSARRDTQDNFGEIVAFYPASKEVDTLERKKMPDSLYFQPHGIYLDRSSDPPVLYCISHEHDKGFHPVTIWDVYPDSIVFNGLISSELLHSPNALVKGEKGEIYVVNDSGKRGSLAEKILKLNRANVVKLWQDSSGTWDGTIAASGLGFPAGINRIGSTLYVGDAIHHCLHVYAIREGNLIPENPIRGLRGNDNIRVIDHHLYLTGHVKPMKFVAHTKSPDNRSPVRVWEVDPVSREITPLFYDDGGRISAGSTALLIDGKLYISQVFDPFILEVHLEDK